MCWAKTQSRAEANPREIMGWNEYTFRMKTDVILHKARKKVCSLFFFFFLSQSSSRLAPGQRVHEGEARFLSLLDNRSRREKKLESCWVTGDLEEKGSHCWAGEGNPWVSHFIRWLEDKWQRKTHWRGSWDAGSFLCRSSGGWDTHPASFLHKLSQACVKSSRQFFPCSLKDSLPSLICHRCHRCLRYFTCGARCAY